jgi:hypothetical protein
MENALERMFVIYKQMTGLTEIGDGLRNSAEDHVKKLFEAGETDEQRLTVSGLTYLKKASTVDA